MGPCKSITGANFLGFPRRFGAFGRFNLTYCGRRSRIRNSCPAQVA